LNMFFPFSSVSNQTYLLRKNRYQLTVFDRLNSYNYLLIPVHMYYILLIVLNVAKLLYVLELTFVLCVG